MKISLKMAIVASSAALLVACGPSNNDNNENNTTGTNNTTATNNDNNTTGTNNDNNTTGTNNDNNTTGTNNDNNTTGTNNDNNTTGTNNMPGNVVEVATGAGGFDTLLTAATDVGLADALATTDGITVFAPTDQAFTDLGVDLSPVSADVIANILLHHVIPAEADSGTVVSTDEFTTLANTGLAVDATGDPVTIGGAPLSATLDVMASNGIIHAMDGVIVPPTIVDVAAATGDLSSLVTAVGQSSQATQDALAPDTLAGDDPITVFAPTNQAFTDAGIDPADLDAATADAVLAHHVISGQVLSTDLMDGMTATTLNGDLTINVDADGNVTITDGMGNTANVVATLVDIRTLTGVVHVIDGVLMPSN